MNLEAKDMELLEAARQVISANYDHASQRHTVGAALLCGSGKIYTGVNLYSVHNVCAEQVALGSAIAAGERDFVTVAVVCGERGETMLPPCGCCRQIFSELAPDCMVILPGPDGTEKIPAHLLLPLAYRTPSD